MRTSLTVGGTVLALLIGLSGPALAQSEQSLPVPGYEAAKDMPGAKELPDPSLTYKIVFDIGKAAPKIDQVNPGLAGVAKYVNTLAHNGVPANHRMIAIIFHQDATDIVQNNEAFKTRNDGHDNPNMAVIQSLKKAGVDLRVCGQALLARKIDPKAVQPEIQVDLWALTTRMNLLHHGYVESGVPW